MGALLQLVAHGTAIAARRFEQAGRALARGTAPVLPSPPPGRPTLDRAAAAAWAVEHVDDADVIVPDCAHFVSQALLLGGGLPPTAAWRPGLQPSRIRRWRRIAAHPAFGAAADFVVEMRRAGYARVVGLDTAQDAVSGAEVGDVVVYNWDGSGAYQHLALVTEIVDGVPFVTQHTPAQRRRQWNRYGDGNRVETASLLHFLTGA